MANAKFNPFGILQIYYYYIKAVYIFSPSYIFSPHNLRGKTRSPPPSPFAKFYPPTLTPQNLYISAFFRNLYLAKFCHL